MNNKYFCVSALFLLAIGCNSVQPNSFLYPPTVIDIPTLTDVSATPEIQAPQTSLPDIGAVISCFEGNSAEISLTSIAAGTLVIQRLLFTSPILLEIQSNKIYEISPTSEMSYTINQSVSPDGNLLATLEEEQNEFFQVERIYLRVFNARGELLEKIIFETPGIRKIHWIDNENILLYTAKTSQDGTVLLINPFTKKQKYITNELPGFFDESTLLFPNLNWLIEYSPDLEWGVYLKRDTSGSVATPFPGGPNIGPAVYNFSANKAIWIPKYPIDFYEEPKWSPDGGKVVIEANNQLTIVMRDGTLEPILDETKTNNVQFPGWSPDGRYIAFWNIDKFLIYDVQENLLYNLCVNTNFDFFQQQSITWSPNSRYIVINTYSGMSSTLIDVKENKVYKLSANPDTFFSVGWMNSVP